MSNKFRSLRGTLNQILNGESGMSPEDFEEQVYAAYQDDELSGTEYDWLMNNIE